MHSLSLGDQESLHRLSSGNRDALRGSARAGCFYCCEIFSPNEIKDWVDGRQVETGSLDDGITALCPRCGIDAVLPEAAGVTLNKDLLVEMRAHWF
jgi:hypothetical protein